jgi:hypothetical protein
MARNRDHSSFTERRMGRLGLGPVSGPGGARTRSPGNVMTCRHRMLDVLCGASLLAAVACAGMWVRSEWVADVVSVQRIEPRAGLAAPLVYGATAVASDDGGVIAWDTRFITSDLTTVRRVAGAAGSDDTLPSWRSGPSRGWVGTRGTWLGRAGFAWEPAYWRPNGRSGELASVWRVRIPYWSLVTGLGLPPAWWCCRRRARRARQRRAARLCTSCGYDLRATPERCPECGRWATGSAEAVSSETR